MLPVFALVGRPNVGKSTLFNRLTVTRDAIVNDQPGVTRDRLYGRGKLGKQDYLVVDTGGITFDDKGFDPQIHEQVDLLLQEADELLFLVDAKDGILALDEQLAQKLRKTGINVTVLVNKSEGQIKAMASADFQRLGLGKPVPISASRGDGVRQCIDDLLANYPNDVEPVDDSLPRVALVGRPNAGKSTLTNALLGEQRVIVSEIPGTTRDSINVEVEHDGVHYVVTDTAGVRRRSRVDETLEKFSVIKTLQAVERCNVVVLLLDAHAGISAQDVTIANMVQEMGRAVVMIINKWDGLNERARKDIEYALELKFPFMQHVETLRISAQYGTAVSKVLPMVKRAYDSCLYDFTTAELNRFLEKAVERNAPPMRNGRKIKIKFGHQAGKNPPVIVLHGNQVDKLPKTYLRYLQKALCDSFGLVGILPKLIARVEENPFKPDPNVKRKERVKSKARSNARRKLRR